MDNFLSLKVTGTQTQEQPGGQQLMSKSISEFMDSVQGSRERKSLRNSVKYRQGLGWSEDDILHWLSTGENPKGAKPSTGAASADHELRDSDIPQEMVDAVLREMKALQTAELTSSAGVVIEMKPRERVEPSAPEPHTAAEKVEAAEAAPVLGLTLRALILAAIVGATTFHLVQATVPVYGILPAILLEIMPLAFIFFVRSRLLKIALVLAFAGSGFYTLSAIHSAEVSGIRAGALESSPEYQRLTRTRQGLQAEHDGLDALKSRTRRAQIRTELKPIESRMTEIEAAASSRGAGDGESKAHVNFLVRVLMYLGSLVLTHALAVTLRMIPSQALVQKIKALI